MRRHPEQAPAHAAGVRRAHQRLLVQEQLTSSTVTTSDGALVHVIEQGTGPAVVLLHGTGSPAMFWLPLLRGLEGIRWIAVDRPGFGLSDPTPPAGACDAVAWVEDLLDTLGLCSPFLVGHSMGGLWSLRFALARPGRLRGLAMIGAPGLPGTRAPLPFRLLGTPGLGSVIGSQRETPRSVRQFAGAVGEGATITAHPDLIELLVEVGNDPVARRVLRREVRLLLSPWALLTRSGFRGRAVLGTEDLARLAVPALLVWGDRDPVGGAEVARQLQAMLPDAALEVVRGGHAPWLGCAPEVAKALTAWIQEVVVATS